MKTEKVKFEGLVDDDNFILGTFFDENGNIYQGEFKNNLLNGIGIIKYSNGDEYHGEVLDGKKHRYGEIKKNNGEFYTAHFNDDEIINIIQNKKLKK